MTDAELLDELHDSYGYRRGVFPCAADLLIHAAKCRGSMWEAGPIQYYNLTPEMRRLLSKAERLEPAPMS